MNTTEEYDELMQGYKISMSVSCPSNLLESINRWMSGKHCNLSQGVSRLIRLGLTYQELLQEQARLEALEKIEPEPPVVVKAKTPRKKARK